MTWSEMDGQQRRDFIRPLWLDGKSARYIAELVSTTRNAVIGVVHRMKLPKRANAIRDKPERQKRVRYMSAEIDDPINLRDLIDTNRQPLPGRHPIGLLDLPNRPNSVCRYPVVGGYCGAPSGDKTYCPSHYPLAYHAPKRTGRTIDVSIQRHGDHYQAILKQIKGTEE